MKNIELYFQMKLERSETINSCLLYTSVCVAKHLEPRIPEECLVSKLSYHYEEDIIRARRNSQIKTVQAMTELLEMYEHEDYYRQSRRRYERPEPRNNTNNNNRQNGNNNNNYSSANRNNARYNNNPVSYTHLDVYKRQHPCRFL